MSDEDKIRHLKSITLFEGLNPTEISVIAQATKEEKIAPNTIFIEQEGHSQVAYFIVSGSVRVYRITDEGEEVNLAVLGPGEVVGEMALIDEGLRSAYVETIQPTKLLILKREDFQNILHRYPEAAINLLKTLSERVRTTNQYVEDILSKNLSDRTWKTLQALSKYFPNKDITLSQEELAAIVGGTRARITEVLNKLKAEGKISLSHRHIRLT